MEYFCFFHSYLQRCKKLTDEEFGMLVRSLANYSETGERSDLPDKLQVAFDFIAVDIDAGHAKAKDTSKKRTKAVQTRWNHTNDTNESDEFICTHTKTNTKTKTKTNSYKDKYGGQNFDQKVIKMSELSNLIN